MLSVRRRRVSRRRRRVRLPASCASGAKCLPQAVARPNVVLVISDDQGECHYGSAGECRSTQTGTPIPAPATPALDALAAGGTHVRDRAQHGVVVLPVAEQHPHRPLPEELRRLPEPHRRALRDDPALAAPARQRAGYGRRSVRRRRAHRRLLHAPGRQVHRVVRSRDRLRRAHRRRRAATRSHRLHGRARRAGRRECGTDGETVYDPFVHQRTCTTSSSSWTAWSTRSPAAPRASSPCSSSSRGTPRASRTSRCAPRRRSARISSAPTATSGLFKLGAALQRRELPADGPRVRREQLRHGPRVLRERLPHGCEPDASSAATSTKTSAPHCIGANGRSRFQETTPAACHGTWATGTRPIRQGNTDHRLHVRTTAGSCPSSKHNFSENGYRTRMIVYDPRKPSGTQSDALVHSTDVLPSVPRLRARLAARHAGVSHERLRRHAVRRPRLPRTARPESVGAGRRRSAARSAVTRRAARCGRRAGATC